MVLSEMEIDLLRTLGQIPFLPVARTAADPTPIFPEDPGEETSLVIACLEKRGLITVDFDKPLSGSPEIPYPICGSMALTERGQAVLELLDIHGFTE